LEKTLKIIQSNRQPNPTMPAKPCPEVSYLHVFFERLQGWWLNHLPGQPVPMLFLPLPHQPRQAEGRACLCFPAVSHCSSGLICCRALHSRVFFTHTSCSVFYFPLSIFCLD